MTITPTPDLAYSRREELAIALLDCDEDIYENLGWGIFSMLPELFMDHWCFAPPPKHSHIEVPTLRTGGENKPVLDAARFLGIYPKVLAEWTSNFRKPHLSSAELAKLLVTYTLSEHAPSDTL